MDISTYLITKGYVIIATRLSPVEAPFGRRILPLLETRKLVDLGERRPGAVADSGDDHRVVSGRQSEHHRGIGGTRPERKGARGAHVGGGRLPEGRGHRRRPRY